MSHSCLTALSVFGLLPVSLDKSFIIHSVSTINYMANWSNIYVESMYFSFRNVYLGYIKNKCRKNNNRFKKLKFKKERREREKKKKKEENSTELQKPNVEAGF